MDVNTILAIVGVGLWGARILIDALKFTIVRQTSGGVSTFLCSMDGTTGTEPDIPMPPIVEQALGTAGLRGAQMPASPRRLNSPVSRFLAGPPATAASAAPSANTNTNTNTVTTSVVHSPVFSPQIHINVSPAFSAPGRMGCNSPASSLHDPVRYPLSGPQHRYVNITVHAPLTDASDDVAMDTIESLEITSPRDVTG
jgi:hypothetical protein